jgi:hypothetical protein
VVVVAVVVVDVGARGERGVAKDELQGSVVVHGFMTQGPPAGVFAEGSDVGWFVKVSGGKGESEEGDDGEEDEGETGYSCFEYMKGSV